MGGEERERSNRLLAALMRGRRRRLVLAAALIAVAVNALWPAPSWPQSGAGGGVLYVGAPGVSYPSAREAGSVGRSYLGEASHATLLALGFTDGEAQLDTAHRALATISESPVEGAGQPTPEAALRAGEIFLAQAGRPAWENDETPPYTPPDGEFAATPGPEGVRPELGEGTEDPDESPPSSERADAPRPQTGDGSNDGASETTPEYAVVETNAPDTTHSPVSDTPTSIAAPDAPAPTASDATDAPTSVEESAVAVEPEEDAAGQSEEPDGSSSEEFASLAAPSSPDEVPNTSPAGGGVLSEEAVPSPLPESGDSPEFEEPAPPPDPGPVEPPMNEPVDEEASLAPPPSPSIVASPPSTSSQEHVDDEWVAVSSGGVSVEVDVDGSTSETGAELGAADPMPPPGAPHSPSTPQQPRPEISLPTEPTSEPPSETPPGSSAEGSSPGEPPSLGDRPDEGGAETGAPSDMTSDTPDEEPEAAPGDSGPDPDAEPGAGDATDRPNPGNDANAPPESSGGGSLTPEARLADSPPTSPAPDGGDAPDRVRASTNERRIVSRNTTDSESSGEVSTNGLDAPDVERPMIRVRRVGSGAYTVERVRPGGSVAPIYTGGVGSQEAVAIGTYSGGVPPEGMHPTPAALEEAEAELSSYQSTGRDTPTAPATAPPSVPDASSRPADFGDSAQSTEPRTVQTVEQIPAAPQTPAVEQVPTVPEIPTYTQEQATQSTSMSSQPPPEYTVIEQDKYEQTVYGQSTASGVDGAGREYSVEAPYQPPIQTTSSGQDVAPETLGQPLQPSAQRAGVIQTAPALPAAGTVAESPAPIPPLAHAPEPQGAGWSGHPGVESQLSAQPAATTTIQTNIETTQNSAGGSTVGASIPGG